MARRDEESRRLADSGRAPNTEARPEDTSSGDAPPQSEDQGTPIDQGLPPSDSAPAGPATVQVSMDDYGRLIAKAEAYERLKANPASTAPARAPTILTRGPLRFRVLHGCVGPHFQGAIIGEKELGKCDLERLVNLGAIEPIAFEDPMEAIRDQIRAAARPALVEGFAP